MEYLALTICLILDRSRGSDLDATILKNIRGRKL